MKRVFVSACLGTLIVAAAMTGCTAVSTADGTADRPQSRKTGAKTPARELTDAEQVRVERAEEHLVKKCMEREGFTYWVGRVPSVPERRSYGYVLDDVRWAEKYGYGTRLQQQAERARLNDRNIAYDNALPRAERLRYSKALDGRPSNDILSAELPGGGAIETPRRGCRADAKDRLYGDFPAWFRVEKTATNLTPLYVPELVRDKRFLGAVGAWSTCMREEGHDYADPSELREELPALVRGLSREKAHTTEVKLAVVEATCSTETSLGDTARALEDEYRDKKLKRYSDDIATYRRMGLAALARAEHITG
ncbi:hypothetical protein OIE71_28545 [Streptomyces sp. NBC_01725]|uniref:hypothetical protein n=1 Tax=Streptomyces sp. NBC_01725 TaxID=2975923 RepID=UPI002E2CAF09|nr:hypothetical protein [Streptomyces sp. NBC_01725]